MMLLLISGFATWHGMRDFIIGVSTSPAGNSQQLPGGMSFSNDFLVIIVVFALTFLMWLMLRETFGAGAPLDRSARHLPALRVPRHLVDRLRLRLLVEPDRRRGGDAHRPFGLAAGCGRCRRRRGGAPRRGEGRLDGVVTWSESQMAREETSGGSCGTSSGAGRGPLYNARVGVRDQIASLRDGVQNSWLGTGAGRHRIPAKERRATARDDRRRAPAELQRHGEQHPLARPRHRRPLQRARQVDGDRDARDRRGGFGGAGAKRASPATTRRWRSA